MYFLVAVLRGAVLDAVVMSKNRPRERAERKTDFFIITITNKSVFYCKYVTKIHDNYMGFLVNTLRALLAWSGSVTIVMNFHELFMKDMSFTIIHTEREKIPTLRVPGLYS